MSMNILATGMGWIEHTPGGLNRYFADYLAAMAKAGHTVRGLMTAGGTAAGLPAYMADVAKGDVRSGPLARVRTFRGRVRQELKDQGFRPDVFNPHFALYASLVTRRLLPGHIPIVSHFHGPWAEESLVEDRSSPMLRRIRYQAKKEVEQLLYRRSDRFIVLSRHFQSILSESYGAPRERIHIIPGAVDTRRFCPAFDREHIRRRLGIEEGRTLLFCARRLVNRMGIDRLIRAMAAVRSRTDGAAMQDMVLYIAGDGPLRSSLKQLVEELRLGGCVHLLGRVSNEELVAWYQAADISVVPTVTLEGFGLVSAESLSCGTPVLGTPYGGTREILPELAPGLLFADGTPEAMAEKLISVWRRETVLPSREQCRRHVLERYTWDRVAHAVESVFIQALEERSADRYVRAGTV